MRIIISNSAGVPIYEQIKEQIKSAIFSGELNEGEALPSIRALARDLQVSVITTTRAYGDLEQEGFVTNVQGKGCFVLPQNKELALERARTAVEESLAAAIAAARGADIPKREFTTMLDILMKEEDYD